VVRCWLGGASWRRLGGPGSVRGKWVWQMRCRLLTSMWWRCQGRPGLAWPPGAPLLMLPHPHTGRSARLTVL
jgi:hypothetical protein